MNTSLWLIFEKVSFFPARAFSTHNFLCVHFIHLVHIVIDTHIHSLSNLCLIFTINLSKNYEFLIHFFFLVKIEMFAEAAFIWLTDYLIYPDNQCFGFWFGSEFAKAEPRIRIRIVLMRIRNTADNSLLAISRRQKLKIFSWRKLKRQAEVE